MHRHLVVTQALRLSGFMRRCFALRSRALELQVTQLLHHEATSAQRSPTRRAPNGRHNPKCCDLNPNPTLCAVKGFRRTRRVLLIAINRHGQTPKTPHSQKDLHPRADTLDPSQSARRKHAKNKARWNPSPNSQLSQECLQATIIAESHGKSQVRLL